MWNIRCRIEEGKKEKGGRGSRFAHGLASSRGGWTLGQVRDGEPVLSVLPHGRASSVFCGVGELSGAAPGWWGIITVVVHDRRTASAAVVARRGGGDARPRSAGFASDRQRLASGLPHGLVLAPGAQGGLCGGALTGERF